LQKYIKRK